MNVPLNPERELIYSEGFHFITSLPMFFLPYPGADDTNFQTAYKGLNNQRTSHFDMRYYLQMITQKNKATTSVYFKQV